MRQSSGIGRCAQPLSKGVILVTRMNSPKKVTVSWFSHHDWCSLTNYLGLCPLIVWAHNYKLYIIPLKTNKMIIFISFIQTPCSELCL